MFFISNLLIPKNDIVFHSVFKRGNEDITKAFIESIIQKKIKSIDLDKDKILTKEFAKEKLGILDLKATLDNNTICSIEIQVNRNGNELKRFLHYHSKNYSSQLKIGQDYNEILPVITIVIVDYDIPYLSTEKAHTRWKMFETEYRQKLLTDDFEIHIIIMPRALKESINKELLQWLMFLDNPNSMEVQKMVKENKNIGKAMKKLEAVSDDKHLRRLAELREKAKCDEISGLNWAHREGLAEGQAKGRAEGKTEEKIEIAKSMLNEKLDIKLISKITGLSESEIQNLK